MKREESDRSEDKRERFMALLEPVLARLSRFCHALTLDAEEGRDLLGDAILLAYEHFESLRAEEAFLSFVFTTARRLYYRRERRRKLWGTLGDRPHGHDPSDQMENSIDAQFLNEALRQLPAKQREAVVLFEVSGLSLEEIRKIQGGSLSGVKSRIVRGREQLKRLLGETTNTRPVRTVPFYNGGDNLLERTRLAMRIGEEL